MKYTITRLMAELKLLDKKIERGTRDLIVIGVDIGGEPVKALQSLDDLIARRNELKMALMVSNMTVRVVVAEVEMSVLQAIETKTVMEYKLGVLSQLKSQYAQAMRRVERKRQENDETLASMLVAAAGKDVLSPEAITAISEPFQENNKVEIESGTLSLKLEIEKRQGVIDAFTTEVDYVLSQSNALTEVDL